MMASNSVLLSTAETKLMISDWLATELRQRLSAAVRHGILASLLASPVLAQTQTEPNGSISPKGRAKATAATADTWYLGFPRFKIPFNVDATKTDLAEVQLWVSTDAGETWQMHGIKNPKEKNFDFRAAAEGEYYFSVQTVDKAGNSFPSQSPPLKVFVDTTDPETAIRADLNAVGQLVVDVRVADENLLVDTATLRLRTDRDTSWQDVHVADLELFDGVYQGQVLFNVPQCREIGIVFAVSDRADNQGEAKFQFAMPRTAGTEQDMTLASTPVSQTGIKSTTGRNIPNSVAWNPSPAAQDGSRTLPAARTPRNQFHVVPPGQANSPPVTSPPSRRSAPSQDPGVSVVDLKKPAGNGPGMLATSSQGPLSMSPSVGTQSGPEELPTPVATDEQEVVTQKTTSEDTTLSSPIDRQVSGDSAFGKAYHCKSRAFSLDYSVEALGGTTLSEIELWGTEDGGRNWQQWGSDPDRQSPFDVQVGNDGLFGFRMVIVSENGIVSNRPKSGDSADVWINVDTSVPEAKITRAVYGEGPEDGMLVIDYECGDGHLVERPITLSFSEGVDGPWTPIANGLKNTGIYLWKASREIPEQIFIRLEVVDKAGNVGLHRLDVPIDTKGLAPRGRIQGFRPILSPSK